MEKNAAIFALDIGTRSIIGIIMQPLSDGKFQINDMIIIEHEERSMLNGQIHDILAVSKTIQKVKNYLETNNGPLRYAAVAAAGRSLETLSVTLDKNIESQPLLTREDIRILELSAVQEAQKCLLNSENKKDIRDYHCVGYSVVNYFLDDQIIKSLIEQRGKKVSVEIIATFLPNVVVDSLIASLHKANLEMQFLTLEPIAAINVLIPSSMRKINIAFVDVGAGTSDIAITSDGTIVAYGMVPFAGDEITDAICQKFLLDFNNAEDIKRKLNTYDEISFTDILGTNYKISSSDLIKEIDADINNLAKHISNKIIELNGKPPKAVMLVGGGSQTAKLTEKIAFNLGIPSQRVAVRGADAVEYDIDWPENTIKGPDLITPIGIAVASIENPVSYTTVLVNNEIVRLFDMKSLTVSDAIIASGIPIKKIIGKPGKAMTININGTIKIIPGEHGTMPKILLNGHPATLESKIKNSYIIDIKPGQNGADAKLTVEEALKYSSIKSLSVTIENKQYNLLPLVKINNIDVGYSNQVNDRDSLLFEHITTIEEALVITKHSTKPFAKISFNLNIMGNSKTIPYVSKKIYKNGKITDLNEPISESDIITFDKFIKPYPSIDNFLKDYANLNCQINVTFNGQQIKMKPKSLHIRMNEQIVNSNTLLEPNSKINIEWDINEGITYRDIFRYVDLSTSKGRRYEMLVNGEHAEFNTPINNGDKLQLIWKN